MTSLILSGCERSSFNFPWLKEETPGAPAQTEAPPENTETPDVIATQTQPEASITELTIWIPPEMDPALESEASLAFANRLAEFSDSHDGLQINVRVKASSGVAGILNYLTSASVAAPDILPDLIALSRPDLESAAIKGLVFPVEDLTDIPDDSDWFPFAKEMALLQGSTFGLPFATDHLVIVYRPSIFEEPPTSWSDLFDQSVPLSFPAGSDEALFALVLYLAEGGFTHDNQRRPSLDADPLTEVYRFFQEGISAGVFSELLIDYLNDEQVWAAFQDGQTDMIVTWASNYLREGPADAMLIPIFTLGDNPITIATGTSWAVATPDENRQALAVELAEFLVAPEFLETWSAFAGYVPPRPTALAGWKNQSLRTTLSQIAVVAQLRPAKDIMLSIGPLIKEGAVQILQSNMDPAQAALVAVESLEE
jgi:ABC-type glycerol-3-phosphate transport system substrate-binding protein